MTFRFRRSQSAAAEHEPHSAIRGGAIGDFILTLPALKALRERIPTPQHIPVTPPPSPRKPFVRSNTDRSQFFPKIPLPQSWERILRVRFDQHLTIRMESLRTPGAGVAWKTSLWSAKIERVSTRRDNSHGRCKKRPDSGPCRKRLSQLKIDRLRRNFSAISRPIIVMLAAEVKSCRSKIGSTSEIICLARAI